MADLTSAVKMKRMTVRLNDDIEPQMVNAYVQALGGHVIRTFTEFPFIVIEVPGGKIESLEQHDSVAEVFEDNECYALEQQLPWGIDRIDAELVQTKFGIKGYGVKIAVADTGIDLSHPDLKVYGGASFISSSYQDDSGHGTHVAGTIAALDNDIGVVGVAPEAQLYALKVLNSGGSGNWSDLAAAIEWSINNKMDIISMSLGGTSGDPLLQTAITKAYQAGIILIASAGNIGNANGTGDNVLYPAKYPEVIAVAAIDSTDKRAAFSSTGSKVELAAPGVKIYSTTLGSAYKNLDGTSMAAPHVTGLAALIKSTYPNFTNEQVRNKLTETAIDLGGSGRDTLYGFGLVNAPAAVSNPGLDISPPQIFFRTPGVDETVSGTVKIEVLAQDLSGVKSLKLIVDDLLLAQWSTPPYIYYWDTTKISAGSKNLMIEAVDGAGNIGLTKQLINVGATINFFDLKDGFVVKDDVSITAVFSDNAVVLNANLYVDGKLQETKVPVNNEVKFIWNSRTVRILGTSKHEVKVVAATDGGFLTSASVNLILRNPVISIVQPTNNKIIENNLVVTAHATDYNGIEKVDFLMDGTLQKTLYAKPYTMDINTTQLGVGNHYFKSVVYSKSGHVAESKDVTVKKPTTITFVSPVSGSIIKGKYSISVKFADKVTSAELLVENKSIGTKSVNGVGPVSWVFDTTGYQDLTPLEIRVNALTSKDQVLSTAYVNVTIDNYTDLVPPVVRLISPIEGYLINTPQIEITAEAADDKGIDRVEFLVNDISVGSIAVSPYKINYDSLQLPAGKHRITAKAVDSSGNIGTSGPVEILKPTTVRLIDLDENLKVSGNLNQFIISCSDQIIGPVKLYIDDRLCQTVQLDTPANEAVVPYSWDTTDYPNLSQHLIKVEVRTFSGDVASQGYVNVTVDNVEPVDVTPPTVTLVSSQLGVVEGTVILTAQASDNKGIERVEFYMNGSLVENQVFASEYEWDPSKFTAGNYSFVAKAFDASGNYSLSNIINLFIPTQVIITKPEQNTRLIGIFNDFTVSFNDPIQGNVDIYVDGVYKATTLIDSPTSGPIRVNYNWDTTVHEQLSQHEITIMAKTSADGIMSKGTVRVYVDNRTDETSPNVSLSASYYGIDPGEITVLTAVPVDDSGISKVEFYMDDSLCSTVSKPPYNYEWHTGNQSSGKYKFEARAYDFAGNWAASNQVFVGLKALVNIMVPSNGQVVGGIINQFKAEFSHPVQGYVYLFIDGDQKANKYIGLATNEVTIDFPWDTTGLQNESSHKIKIRGYTATGQVRSENSVSVTVKN